MSKVVDILEEGSQVVVYHKGCSIVIFSSDEGFSGNIFTNIVKDIEDIQEDPFDGGTCDGTAEEAIEFFVDMVDTHITNKIIKV